MILANPRLILLCEQRGLEARRKGWLIREIMERGLRIQQDHLDRSAAEIFLPSTTDHTMLATHYAMLAVPQNLKGAESNEDDET